MNIIPVIQRDKHRDDLRWLLRDIYHQANEGSPVL